MGKRANFGFGHLRCSALENSGSKSPQTRMKPEKNGTTSILSSLHERRRQNRYPFSLPFLSCLSGTGFGGVEGSNRHSTQTAAIMQEGRNPACLTDGSSLQKFKPVFRLIEFLQSNLRPGNKIRLAVRIFPREYLRQPRRHFSPVDSQGNSAP